MRIFIRKFTLFFMCIFSSFLLMCIAARLVSATSFYDMTTFDDPVIVNSLVHPSWLIYPNLADFEGMTYAGQEAAISSLDYAGTDDWWIPELGLLVQFFGDLMTDDNADPGMWEMRYAHIPPVLGIAAYWDMERVDLAGGRDIMDSDTSAGISAFAIANAPEIPSIPEPSTFLLFSGVMGMLGFCLKKKSN